MNNYIFSRRNFFNYAKLFFLFFLASCTRESKKIIIGFQKSFIPEYFKSLIPNLWVKENINLNDIYKSNNIQKYKEIDYLLVNDGWINNINFDDFKDFDKELFLKLNKKAKNYLSLFDINIRNKIYPIGVIPYVVVIKKNYATKNISNKSWDFLLSKDLKGKIILPNSPRIIMSLAERIDNQGVLNKLINQDNIYDDKNALDWLLNSKAVIAVVPFNLCQKYLKIDSRLSFIFPRTGVPLIWQFVLNKKYSENDSLIKWINSLENYNASRKLEKEGWILPFKDIYNVDFNNENLKNQNILILDQCWQNSWSFPPLNEEEKTKIEIIWKDSLTP